MEDNLFYLLGAIISQAIDDYVAFKPRDRVSINTAKQQKQYQNQKAIFDSAEYYLFDPCGVEEILMTGGLNIDIDSIRSMAIKKRERNLEYAN